MASKKNKATNANVVLIPEKGLGKDENKLYRYTGDGYLPLAAQEYRAQTKAEAIEQFNEDLDDFSYGENDNDPSEADDPPDLGRAEAGECRMCDRGTHSCCHDCG